MAKFVALYCRLSPRPDGSYEGVDVQERWGREYAAGTWPGLPVRVFPDAGLSAAKDDVVRPGYDQLRAAVGSGEIAHLWTVEQSRLERREGPWFTFAAELEAAGIPELHTNRDGIVMVSDVLAGIKAVMNAAEIRVLRRRVNDKLDARAADGIPPGSRPFGYQPVGRRENRTYEQVPEQAEAIRWAAERVLAGWSMNSIVTELGKRGVRGNHRVKVRKDGDVVLDEAGQPVTRPGKLTRASMTKTLLSPTVAGHRVHRGQDLGPGSGNWEPILDEATWKAVGERLRGPRTVLRSDGKIPYVVGAAHKRRSYGREYVLTGGLVVCGVCTKPLVGSLKQFGKKPGQPPKRVAPYLFCTPRGCVGIGLDETDAYVMDRLWRELDKPQFLQALAADDHAERRQALVDRLDDIGRQRRELAALWATPGELTTGEWKAARSGLDAQETLTHDELAAVPPPLVGVDIATAKAAWPLMQIPERREFVRLFIERVTISRAKPGTRAFDDGRVDIEWRKR